MKQKIFSLLVLMLASVSGAWAVVPTYKVGFYISEASTEYTGVTLSANYGYDVITALIKKAYINYNYDNYEFQYGDIVEEGCNVSGANVNADGFLIENPFYYAAYRVSVIIIDKNDNDKVIANHKYDADNHENDTSIGLTICMYHEQHSNTGNDWQQYSPTQHRALCDDTETGCTNPRPYVYEKHEYENGVCTACGYQEPETVGDFKVVLTVPNGEQHTASMSDATVSLGCKTYGTDDILTLVKQAYASSYPDTKWNYSLDPEQGVQLTTTGVDDVTINNDFSITVGPLTTTSKLNSTRVFQVKVNLSKKSDATSTDQFTATLNIDVFHKAHTFASPRSYESDESYHSSQCIGEYGQCPAENKVVKEDHTWSNDNPNKCSVCQYEKSATPVTEHTHKASQGWEWTGDTEDDYHYHPCDGEGQCTIGPDDYATLTGDLATLFAVGKHNFEGGLCTICDCPDPNYDDGPGQDEHIHQAGNDWYYNSVIGGQGHFHQCEGDTPCDIDFTTITVAQLTELANYGFALEDHIYGSSQSSYNNVAGAGYYTCSACGYVDNTRKNEAHTHSYGSWVYNSQSHHKECKATAGPCNAPSVPDPDDSSDTDGAHTFGTNINDTKYYTCKCGYEDTDRKAEYLNDPGNHQHSYDSEWTKVPDTQEKVGVHYHKCISTKGTCDLVYDGTMQLPAAVNYGEHVYGTSQQGAKYYTCQTCGYVSDIRKNESHEHIYGGWQKDNDYHWKECISTSGACIKPVDFKEKHTYYASDDASTTDIDERAKCSTCEFYNEARKTLLDNAATAAEAMSWQWDYEIPFNFDAPVLNDRRMNAGQCYTIMLPYALELNGLKAYSIEQHNSNIVGFKEQGVTELQQLTPFLVKTETTGNPLNSAMTTIYMTLTTNDDADWMTDAEKAALLSDRGYANSQASIHSTGGRLFMLGSLRYLTGNSAEGRYIMQGKDAEHPNGVFKLISTAGGYDQVDNRACILPMRAFLQTLGGDARQTIDIVFYGADGSTTSVKGLVIDEDASQLIFDLQGRRVQNPRKGGLYIINGKKAVLK